ncbi:hypothetical protein LC613_40135 [Nostoc sphaeroides CHAB 2801]|uniref:hypothetical protein n=1 Tax=Nostoc sphaeroides TaxID=446679 RepID=UPI001E635E34|nr:hypothetical protein [Nostoc sphaeroides]MCC5633646.1 hypothetical protein [Nostoc sphaeroides CHAB 2801]
MSEIRTSFHDGQLVSLFLASNCNHELGRCDRFAQLPAYVRCLRFLKPTLSGASGYVTAMVNALQLYL